MINKSNMLVVMYDKVQVLTLKSFFSNRCPKLPAVNITFKAAQHTGNEGKGHTGLVME